MKKWTQLSSVSSYIQKLSVQKRITMIALICSVFFGTSIALITHTEGISLTSAITGNNNTAEKQTTPLNKSTANAKLSSSSQATTNKKDTSPPAASSISNSTYRGPIDGQPDGDKLATPKTYKPLIISPSSVTVYKTNGVPFVKDGIGQVSVIMTNPDGKAMIDPTPDMSSGVTITASDFTSRASWSMEATGEYAAPGTYNVPVSTIAADDSVGYKGSIQVTVANLPGYFSIATARLSGTPFDGGIRCEYPTISYSGNLSSADIPVISGITPNGIALYVLNTFTFNQTVQLEPVTTVPSFPDPGQITEIIQNKYQEYQIPCVYV